MSPSFIMSGSILAGTAEHRLASVETTLAIEADHDVDAIRAVVDQAERMCFVLDSIQRSHEVTRITTLNGESL